MHPGTSTPIDIVFTTTLGRGIVFKAEHLLAERFAAQRDGRAGPVFFIEHGLGEAEVLELGDAVREAVRRHPPESDWWRVCPLPLIVSAVEVGYRYRGAGTDFWPKLETALGIEFSTDSRQNLRVLFEVCSSRFRGARPPATPWATAFRLIAWPITHALVPREFHRHLAATLANLRADVSAFDDASLYRTVRIAAGRPSARFATFMEDQGLMVSVIRALMGGGKGEISEDTIARIAEDLASDPDARRDITLASRAQRRLRTQREPPAEPVISPALAGQVQLRRLDGGSLVIEAQFPPVQSPDADRLRRTLRRQRFAPKFWGVSSPVPSEQFLSGLPFIVKLTSVPGTEASLFDGFQGLEVDPDLLRILDSFELEFRPPMLFAANSDEDLARTVRGKEISGHRVYWLLAADQAADTFTELPRLGEVGPFTCFKLDPSDAGAGEALERWGYHVRFGVSVSIAGAPPLENFGTVPRFVVGDERIVVPYRVHPSGAHVRLGGERIPLDGDLVRVDVPEGEHFLEISSQGASRLERFEGVQEPSTEMPRICWIELIAPEMTVQALLSASMALRIDGLAALEGLTLTVELEVRGHRVGTTCALGPLPQVLFSDCELWLTLLDEATRGHLLQDASPILHARVGALAAESWTLERRLRPCWWVRGQSGLTLQSELGPLEYGEVAVVAATERPAPAPPEDIREARLLAPMAIDQSVFGPAAEFTTLCTAPDRLELRSPAIAKPRLCRSRRAEVHSLGMEDLVAAWLRWALAEGDSIIAEVRRQQVASQLDNWIVEFACGEKWAEREKLVDSSFVDPWLLLSEVCRETGMGLDTYVDLSPRDEHEIIELAVTEIRRMYPELWVRIGPLVNAGGDARESLLDTEDYEALDAACEGAYRRLAGRYRKAGKVEYAEKVKGADPGATADQWDPVLERVKAGSDLQQLGELLLPTNTAPHLMALDLTFMPLEDIGEELRRWTMESRTALAGPLPSDATLEAILALWIAPEAAIFLDWRVALDTLLAERSLARAVRYLALRARSVRPRGAA